MMKVICFHNADEENGYLSNWYPSTFTLEGIDFSSMEQYMMYRKAIEKPCLGYFTEKVSQAPFTKQQSIWKCFSGICF